MLNKNQGFTLLELMVVLFIMVLGFSALTFNLAMSNSSTEVKSAMREMVSALRYTRGESLILREPVTLDFNINDNSYKISSRNNNYHLDKKIKVDIVTAKEDINRRNGLARFRFFPDGSSTGGRLILSKEKTMWQIDINWLTGGIDTQLKSANDE
jgi:general secretion pathway protein H